MKKINKPNDETGHFVFQVSDQSAYGKQRSAQEVFNFLVKQHSAWGFGRNTANRKAIKAGDKVLFYLTGATNQVFVGSAVLTSGAYEDKTGESKDWYLDPETLRIDLKDVVIFVEPKPRSTFKGIEWRPAQGGSAKISERDYSIITGHQPDTSIPGLIAGEETEFAIEKYLEEHIWQNWEAIFDDDLKKFTDENGNEGKQYYCDGVGYIDILAKGKDGGFVVIELKAGRENDVVIGQVLRYMGWVRQNLAKKTESVTGLIVVGERDKKLEYALKEVSEKVKIKVYRATFRLEDY